MKFVFLCLTYYTLHSNNVLKVATTKTKLNAKWQIANKALVIHFSCIPALCHVTCSSSYQKGGGGLFPPQPPHKIWAVLGDLLWSIE